MSQKLKFTMGISIIAVAVGITLFLRQPTNSNSTATAAIPPTVPVAQVLSRTLAPTTEFTGFLAATNTVELRSRVGGTIDEVWVPEGQMVNKDQALFQIDPRPFQVALDTATAQLRKDEVLASQAQTDLNRALQLVSTGAISRKTYDDALSERNARQAQAHISKAAVAAAKLDLSYAHITAPIAGRIDRILVNEGNLISGGAAGNATLLTTIVTLDPIYVYFDIDEATYLALVKRNTSPSGMPVKLGLSTDPDFTHQGVLDFVGNQVDRSTGTIRARAVVANPDGHLLPGLFARTQLTTADVRPTILINDEAVGTEQGKNYVQVVDTNNTTHYRPIELGPLVDGLRVVNNGLQTGDNILIKGLIRPGMTITPRWVSMQTLEDITTPAVNESSTDTLRVTSEENS